MLTERVRKRTRGCGGGSGQDGGLSLVEVLFATMVLAVAALIAFPTLLSFFELSKMSRQENIATPDLRTAAEQIMATPFSTITSTYVDGQSIPRFDDLHLDEGRLVVNYPNPAADPLEVRLVATWNDHRGRPRREEFRFLRTQ